MLLEQVFLGVLPFPRQYHCTVFFFFFFHWHYSPLWALACRTMSFYFFLSATNCLHLLTPSTWRSHSASSFHLFLRLPLLVPSVSWMKIFLGILSSSILSRWPNQLIICPFIHFTIFCPLLISSSSRFVRLFHSSFSYFGPYILLNIFLSKISRACSSFFVNALHQLLPHISYIYDRRHTILATVSVVKHTTHSTSHNTCVYQTSGTHRPSVHFIQSSHWYYF